MPQIIKDNQVIDNLWSIQEPHNNDTVSTDVPKNTLLCLDDWNANAAILSDRTDVGLWLETSDDIDAIESALTQIPIIAIRFRAFADGRGFSLGRLLRERHQFTGELRALGAPIRDQLSYLVRCGFNAFELTEHYEPKAALASLKDFSESYQTAVDEAEPLFKRVQR